MCRYRDRSLKSANEQQFSPMIKMTSLQNSESVRFEIDGIS